jgi:hypothetical protein
MEIPKAHCSNMATDPMAVAIDTTILGYNDY